MKCFALLACVFAARTPVDVLFRKQKTLDQFRFPNGVRPEIPRTLGTNFKVVSPGGKFEFEVGSHEPLVNVSRLITALQVASGFLENAISFNNQIKVQLDHGKYCSLTPSCHLYSARKLGYSIPNDKMEYIPRKDVILSPYALINQNRPADKRDNKFDMYMQLNTAERFIYPDEYGSHSKSKNADIIRMVVHELSHGLGIYSKLTVNCAIPNFTGPYTTFLYNKTHNTLLFHKTLFDTHLRPYDSSKKFPTATTFLFGDLDFNTFFPTIHTKPEINDTGFLSTHKNSTYFLTKYNTRVDIDTETSTAKGSSFSHVSQRYRNSTEFLMTHLGVYYSIFLEDTSVNQYWKTAPLGNATVEMLETIGYHKNPNPNRNLSQIGLYEQMLPFNQKEGDQVYKQMHSNELLWAIF